MDSANTAPKSTAKKTPSQIRNEEIMRRRYRFAQSLRNDPELCHALSQGRASTMTEDSIANFVTVGRRI